MSVDKLKQLKLKFGSVKITWESVTEKKKLNFSENWDSPYDKKQNGVFIKTGVENNIAILDLDDMQNPTCKQLQTLAEECCNTIIKTRKGFHYYFPFDDEFPHKRNMKSHGFDYLSNKAIAIAPPTVYSMNGDKIEYKFRCFPDDGTMSKMSDELKAYLRELMEERPNGKQAKNFEKVSLAELKKVDKQNITVPKMSNEDMAKVLDSLHVKRCNDYIYWIITGLALKSDGYDWTVWDKFSQRSEKYECNQPYYIWKRLKPNSVTAATIMYWLKQDNYEYFKSIVVDSKINGYDTHIDLTAETEFSDQRMQKLFDDDIAALGEADYKINLNKTKSFQYFNKFFMHILNVNQYYKIQPAGEHMLKFSDSKFESAYAQYHSGKTNFIKLWRSSKDRQRYDSLQFSPMKTGKTNEFNLFRGFRYASDSKTVDLEKIKPILDHIKKLLIKDLHYNYVLDHAAHIRQKPYRKTEVAIILYSDTKGNGKSSIYNILSRVFRGYSQNIDEKDLDARFNNVLFQAKLLIGSDEIKGMGKHDSDRLKAQITQVDIKIEAKGDDIYTISDLANYIFTTNTSVAFKVEDGDRRFAQFSVLEEKDTRANYDKLYALLDDETVLMELDKFLATRDISKFHPADDIPVTDYKKENILFSLPVYIQMIRNQPWNFAGQKFTTKELVVMARNYAQQNKGYSFAFTEKKAERDLGKYLAAYKQRDSDKRWYEFPNDLQYTFDDSVTNTF